MQGLNGTALTLEVIQKARELAVACGDSHIDTGYVLWAILERPHSREACTLEALGVGHRKVKRWLQSFRGSAPKKKGGDPLPATAATEEVFLRAIEEARARNYPKVNMAHLLLGILRHQNNRGADIVGALTNYDKAVAQATALADAPPAHPEW